jgi:hypothetical protein
MTKQHGVQARPEGILKNVITCLCFDCNPLSASKIMKLVYLVDVYHLQLYGEPLTSARYRYWNYGAFSIDVAQSLDELYAEGLISERVVKTRKGHDAFVPTPNVPEAMIRLPQSGWRAIEQVIQDWGDKTTDEVVRYTKEILPFLNTDKYTEIDLRRYDPISIYADEYGVSLAEAATLDIIENEELTKAIHRAEEDMKHGRLFDYEQVFGED